jgi:hypothetical protein
LSRKTNAAFQGNFFLTIHFKLDGRDMEAGQLCERKKDIEVKSLLKTEKEKGHTNYRKSHGNQHTDLRTRTQRERLP